MIPALIDKQDNFEVVRDQIAAILALEASNQQALASAAQKDPADWKLRVFTERSNPWEQYLNDQSDRSPLINVWFDSAGYDPKASNATERQKTDGVFNIDCYGLGRAENDPAGGHKPGDQEAAYAAQRAYRLVRNILMAGEYLYLGLQGLVWSRWPQSVNAFQPQLDGQQVLQVIAVRMTLGVTFNEFSPQVVAGVLDYVSIDFKRAEDGAVIVEADYDYTGG